MASLVLQQIKVAEAQQPCGVWHRDLKPDNILVQTLDECELRVKLIDFSIATVTRPGNLLEGTDTIIAGTLRYIAPEQLMGKPEAASDIYALGIIAYEMLTGRNPFPAETTNQLYGMQVAEACAKPRSLRPRLSEQVERILLKALSFQPRARQMSARELGYELSVALGSEPTRGVEQRTFLTVETLPREYLCYISRDKIDQLFATEPDATPAMIDVIPEVRSLAQVALCYWPP